MNKINLADLEIEQDLYDVVYTKFATGQYTDAVKDAFLHLTEYLREMGGQHGDGVDLVSKVLAGNAPSIKLTKMETETEVAIQNGIHFVMRGLYMAFRNPRNHEKYSDDANTGLRIILMIDTMLKFIRQNIKEFRLDELMRTVFDVYFVESDDYANSIVDRIPENKRYQAFQEVLERIQDGDIKKLQYFFYALYRVFPQQALIEAAGEIGEKMRNGTPDEINKYLFVVRDDMWNKIPVDIRARVENMIIKEVEKGYSNGYIVNGSFGAWGAKFGPHFGLREELCAAILERLSDSWYSQDYISKNFLTRLPKIFITQEEINAVAGRIGYATISNKARGLRSRLREVIKSFPDTWKSALHQEIVERRHSDPHYAQTLLELLEQE